MASRVLYMCTDLAKIVYPLFMFARTHSIYEGIEYTIKGKVNQLKQSVSTALLIRLQVHLFGS